MHSLAFLSTFLMATIVNAARVPGSRQAPFPTCQGARQDPTGKGFARFQYAAGRFDTWSGVPESERSEHAGYLPNLLKCSDECWKYGPGCKGVNWFAWDGGCILMKTGEFGEIQGKGELIETAIKGSCADNIRFMDAAHKKIDCCNVWM